MKTAETSTSLPQGFIDEMQTLSGMDSEALLVSLGKSPEVGVRLNGRKRSSVSFDGAEPVKWCPAGLHLRERLKRLRLCRSFIQVRSTCRIRHR